MGSKPSFTMQSDRPESGGADNDGVREKSGLQEKDKQKFAAEKAMERDNEGPGKHLTEKPATSGKDSGQSTPTEN